MSIMIDEKAREAIKRRQAHGKLASIDLRIVPVLHGGWTIAVEWSHRRDQWTPMVQRVENVILRVDKRIVRYAQWHDLTISAEHFGPIEVLMLTDPLALLHIARWERTHGRPAA